MRIDNSTPVASKTLASGRQEHPSTRRRQRPPEGAIAGMLDCGDCAACGWIQTIVDGLNQLLLPLRAYCRRYQACHEHLSTRRVWES